MKNIRKIKFRNNVTFGILGFFLGLVVMYFLALNSVKLSNNTTYKLGAIVSDLNQTDTSLIKSYSDAVQLEGKCATQVDYCNSQDFIIKSGKITTNKNKLINERSLIQKDAVETINNWNKNTSLIWKY